MGEILARDGDRVKAGDVVLRLDDTITRASLAITTKGLTELAARKARLEAERDGADAVTAPDELASRSSDPQVAHVIAGEQQLFALRQAARVGQKAQLRQRITQNWLAENGDTPGGKRVRCLDLFTLCQSHLWS